MISLGFAGGPASREWFLAVVTQNKSAQRKICTDIFARGNACRFFHTPLSGLEGFQRDRPFIMP